MLTQKFLKESLEYNPETGIFTWIRPYRNKNYLMGKQAGSIGQDGYWFISIGSKNYGAGRLAWFYVHGIWPSGVIDHKDHVITNNAISNLRDVSCAGNSHNQVKAHKDSTFQMLGVDYNKSKKRFRARIQTGGKRINLGGFATADEAYAAYLEAKRKHHVTCTI